ncbi:zinc finger protein ubi-d4-like isoform X2 [Amphiura filiformis]|uniref:zinc finger protein ubi-d4-like isoform X2 n=1 Tax=Amphiura filiformis TaxID=82378 RepID=UPI003B21EAAC
MSTISVENPVLRSDMEQFYKEALENAASFNTRLMNERKMRLPFLDSHTGIAQNNSYLWMQKRHRGPGLEAGQIYTYPSRRWRKKKQTRQYYQPDGKLPAELQKSDADTGNEGLSDSQGGETQDSLSHPEAATTVTSTGYSYSGYDKEQEEIMRELECEDDFPDAGEIDRADSDESDEDFEVTTTRKSRGRGKKSGGGPGRGKRKSTAAAMVDTDMPMLSAEDKEKPYACNRVASITQGDHADINKESLPAKKKKGPVEPNNYCDFCLGDAAKNKSGDPEDMVSCAECGHSGHPSCLQFTPSITAKVRSYRWQCIECKSCHLCGTSDNDDQLLFCDDCDRGYHMYCLTPPISSPPEGSWSCELCKAETDVPPKQDVLA